MYNKNNIAIVSLLFRWTGKSRKRNKFITLLKVSVCSMKDNRRLILRNSSLRKGVVPEPLFPMLADQLLSLSGFRHRDNLQKLLPVKISIRDLA